MIGVIAESLVNDALELSEKAASLRSVSPDLLESNNFIFITIVTFRRTPLSNISAMSLLISIWFPTLRGQGDLPRRYGSFHQRKQLAAKRHRKHKENNDLRWQR